MKLFLAILVYLGIGLILALGLVLAAKGSYWLLILSFLAYAAWFGRVGCLPR